jgi:putative transposase
LKEHEAGVSVADLSRKHGVSVASIYKWKAKFGGMEVSEAKRLRTLEDENTKLEAAPGRRHAGQCGALVHAHGWANGGRVKPSAAAA